MTTEHTSSTSSDNAIEDGDMLRAVVTGCAVGIPVVFSILLAIELAVGTELSLAAVGAGLPGVIFGAFIGSAFFIGRASDRAHARAGH
jgi:hypothetical protein